MSMIQMTSGLFSPNNPVTQVTVLSDSATSTLKSVAVTKHNDPVPNGTIATNLSSASVYMDPTEFTALVNCLKNSATHAVISLTYSGTTVTATSVSCVSKAA